MSRSCFFAACLLIWLIVGVVPAAEPPRLTVKSQANVLLADPFPGDADLAPTLVSLDLRAVPANDAIHALEKAAGTAGPAVTYMLNTSRQAGVPVTLKLDRTPLQEALLQIAGLGSMHINDMTIPRSSLYAGESIQDAAETLPARIWSVSGPFCFTFQALEHEVRLATPGSTPDELLILHILADMEPRLRPLRAPERWTITEIVDEKGNSLMPARPADVFVQDLHLRAHLKYPADAGKRIASLQASMTIALATKLARIDLETSTLAEPFVKDAGGYEVIVPPPERKTDAMLFSLQYHRTAMDADKWKEFLPSLLPSRPAMLAENGEQLWGLERDPKIAGDTATRVWEFHVSSKSPVPPKFILGVPTEVRVVTVPFAFKDLPLP
jgi:hypothetical protein